MDFRSPKAFCALAITVFASCAMALPHRNAAQIAATGTFLYTASPLNNPGAVERTRPEYSISSRLTAVPQSRQMRGRFCPGAAGGSVRRRSLDVLDREYIDWTLT